MRRIHLDRSQVVDLYRQGRSIPRIAEHLGVSSGKIGNFMREIGLERRKSGPLFGTTLESNHPRWKGDSAGDSALHKRVARLFGNPSKCATCGTSDSSRVYEWANLTGNYSDVLDYKRMCRQCHRTYDKARQQETGRYTSFKFKGRAYGSR